MRFFASGYFLLYSLSWSWAKARESHKAVSPILGSAITLSVELIGRAICTGRSHGVNSTPEVLDHAIKLLDKLSSGTDRHKANMSLVVVCKDAVDQGLRSNGQPSQHYLG